MNIWLKRTLIGFGSAVGIVLVGGGGFVYTKVSSFDAGMEKVYDIPLPTVALPADAAALERGKHLAESLAACTLSDCHGGDLGGGKLVEAGPIGSIAAPNITKGGIGAAYSDAELLRLLRHGVKKDGRSVNLMPVFDFNWMPDADLLSIIAYVRSMPDVNRANGAVRIGVLGKVLDELGMGIPFSVARRVDHSNIEIAGPPEPTVAYGRFIGKGCSGCHGKHYSGGPIPGAPPDMPIPLNITPHATGLAGWTYEDFDRLLVKGIRKNGKKIDPFMPVEAFGKANEIEKRALFAFLQTVPPREFGGR